MVGLAEILASWQRGKAEDLERRPGREKAMWYHVIETGRTTALLLLLGAYSLPVVPALGASPDPASIAEMRQIKKFVSVEVQTQGTAEKIGLKSAELTDLTRMRFLNKLPGVALEGSNGPPSDGTEPLNQLGFLTCEVWTVGEQQIVAYHIDCNAGSYITPRTPGSLWNRAILGYGPKDEVSEAVRKGLRTMVELFASSFSSARAEGGR
jgi:hypothetical protein